MKDISAVIAGLLAIAATIPYLIDIVKGRTKPNIVSWTTWTLLLAISTAGAFAAHETIFNSPSIGIIAALVIDLIGSLPTLKHSWKDPGEETWQTFAIIVGAASLTLLSLESFTIPSLSFPIYLLLINTAIVAIVVYKRKKLGISLSRHSVHETLHE